MFLRTQEQKGKGTAEKHSLIGASDLSIQCLRFLMQEIKSGDEIGRHKDAEW
jgi:hypothetical protein